MSCKMINSISVCSFYAERLSCLEAAIYAMFRHHYSLPYSHMMLDSSISAFSNAYSSFSSPKSSPSSNPPFSIFSSLASVLSCTTNPSCTSQSFNVAPFPTTAFFPMTHPLSTLLSPMIAPSMITHPWILTPAPIEQLLPMQDCLTLQCWFSVVLLAMRESIVLTEIRVVGGGWEVGWSLLGTANGEVDWSEEGTFARRRDTDRSRGVLSTRRRSGAVGLLGRI